MTRPAIVGARDLPLRELARRFTDDRVGALPIVDESGALVGIVSYIDVLCALSR